MACPARACRAPSAGAGRERARPGDRGGGCRPSVLRGAARGRRTPQTRASTRSPPSRHRDELGPAELERLGPGEGQERDTACHRVRLAVQRPEHGADQCLWLAVRGPGGRACSALGRAGCCQGSPCVSPPGMDTPEYAYHSLSSIACWARRQPDASAARMLIDALLPVNIFVVCCWTTWSIIVLL